MIIPYCRQINVSCLHPVEIFIVSRWNKFTAYLRTSMPRDWTVNNCVVYNLAV